MLSKKSNNFATMEKVLYVISLFIFTSCSFETEKKKEKIEDINSLILSYPDSVNLLVDRGESYFKEYKYDLALADATKAFRLDSNNIKVQMLYAEALNNREKRTVNDVLVAQKNYKKIINQNKKNTRALIGLASTYNYQQDFDKTFQYINEALRINPKYRNAYVLKGTTYRQIGNIELAKSSYQTAIQQDPDFFEAYFFLGQMYQSENNPICIEYFTTALDLKPEYPEVRYQLAFSKQIHGRLIEAVDLYKEMVEDTVDFYKNRAFFHLGYIKQFDFSQIDSAIYFYQKALEVDPKHVESWHNLGLCHKEQGNKTKALKSFSKALKFNPEFKISREEAEKLNK
ncbi:MAG: hypothetical protein CL844_06870 [Crocinitomicaceae bacterium]|nr:hypothetical protein [Crocinitomicaceae bacterium]|tara:strand:- start:33584 stop:34612 length:1029 start_codon:yes stop_codon:yes gene_type:complete